MLSAYGIILRNFVFANMNSERSAPDFVWVIVFSIFVLYNVFGVIQFVQMAWKTPPNIIFPTWLGGLCRRVTRWVSVAPLVGTGLSRWPT